MLYVRSGIVYSQKTSIKSTLWCVLWLIYQKYRGLIQIKSVLLGDHAQPCHYWLWTCNDKSIIVGTLELLAELML